MNAATALRLIEAFAQNLQRLVENRELHAPGVRVDWAIQSDGISQIVVNVTPSKLPQDERGWEPR